MALISLVQSLCSIDITTGLQSADKVMGVCLQSFSSDVNSKIIQSVSPGASGDLVFQRNGSGRRIILLLGHYDTVPHKGVNHYLEGDQFFAPGSYDMKGGVALALKAFNDISSKDFSEVTLYLAGDEEWRAKPLKIKGYWDAILAFEGGEEAGIVSSRFGAGVLEITVLGQFLRATHPPQGTSSIQALANLLLEIEKKKYKKSSLYHFSNKR